MLRDHFKAHFNPKDPSNGSTPEELHEHLPLFVEELQNISANVNLNDDPPTIEEIQKHLQELKNNKASNDIEPEF